MATKKKIAVQEIPNNEEWVDWVLPNEERREHKMTVQGGFTYISFENHSFASGDKDNWEGVSKIWPAIEGSQKPIVVRDLMLNGKEYKPFVANFVHQSNDFIAYVALGTDDVTIKVGADIQITAIPRSS